MIIFETHNKIVLTIYFLLTSLLKQDVKMVQEQGPAFFYKLTDPYHWLISNGSLYTKPKHKVN